MEKRVLGRTGMWVSVIGLGAGSFGAFGDLSQPECVRLAHRAFDGGVNLIDVADFYSLGEAETIVGQAIAGRRDRLVVSSKCGMPLSEDPNQRGGSRRWVMAAVEASLKRLNTDYLDLYHLHQPDPATPIEDTVEAMSDLVRAGKVRYFGFSNSTAAMVAEAALTAELRSLARPRVEQSAFSIFERRPEEELLPVCERHGLGFLAYSPLEGGWLSGRYRRGGPRHVTARQRFRPAYFDIDSAANAPKLEAVEALVGIAEQAGLSLAALAIGFVLAHRGVTAALVGASRLEQLEAHLAAADVRLSDEILDRIDAVAAPGGFLNGAPRATPAMLDKGLRRRPAPAVTITPAGESIRRMFASGASARLDPAEGARS